MIDVRGKTHAIDPNVGQTFCGYRGPSLTSPGEKPSCWKCFKKQERFAQLRAKGIAKGRG